MKICFVSLGCDKNLVDTEKMMGVLASGGHEIVNDENDADAVVVNTCAFIGDAKQESINTLLEMGELKKTGVIKAVIAAGCLAERYSEEIKKEIPEVDAIVGTMAIDEIVKAVENAVKEQTLVYKKPIDGPLYCGINRIVTTGGHFAHLKIAEGCDKHCTYCAIPSFRGKYRSIPMETLVEEASKLVGDGVKELILVAQETTLYGKDLYGKKSLAELLKKLSAIEDLKFIRLLYCYPEEIDDELISEMANNPKVLHYIDMPIQHASDAVLKRMGRKTTRAELTEKINKLREAMPDICIRTTLITGFPGEKASDMKILKDFVRTMRFDRLGVFTFSCEEGTGAANLKPKVPAFIAKSRRNAIMKLQQSIAFEKAKSEVGRELDVMIEGRMSDESTSDKNVYVSRTYKDAPDVDGFLFLETDRELLTGDIIKARVTGADKYDLLGVIKDESAE